MGLVAFTYNGATKRLYVDGREVAVENVSTVVFDPSTPIVVGADRDYGSNLDFFDGLLRELVFFDRALAADEVAALAL